MRPREHGRRLTELFPQDSWVEIEDSHILISEDQPSVLVHMRDSLRLGPDRTSVRSAEHPDEAVTGFEERIYELGVSALADQERQVAEIRGRGSTLLAAGVLIASLLAKPVFHDGHPSGAGEATATVVGLIGMTGVLLFVVLLLRPYQLGFSVRAGATYGALWDQGIVEQPMVDLALADAFEERRNQNAMVVERLVLFLALTLASLLLEAAGLAAAAALSS